MKPWYDDLDEKKVLKATEIPPQIELPVPGHDPIVIVLTGKPYTVETKRQDDMYVAEAVQLKPEKVEGTIILPKSMRFHMAKSIARSGKDFKKVDLVGKAFKVWAVRDGDQTFYHAELYEQQTLQND